MRDQNAHLVHISVGYARPVKMLIDSGAEANILTEQDWAKIKSDYDGNRAAIFDVDFKPKARVRAYASSKDLETICTFKAWLEVDKKPKPRSFAEFTVIRGGGRSLLGRVTSLEMKLLAVGLQVNAVTAQGAPEQFPAVPGDPVSFEVDESVPPVRNPYVSIPAHYRDAANERLRKMEESGIIEKVGKAPKWLSGLSTVAKGESSFRLVINMKGPNKAIRRQYHRMPRVEEIKVKLAGAKFFSKLDLTSAFHHVMLDEKSRELTTFMAPNGMYRFRRLMFGVNCAPEIFQRIMEQVLTGVPKVIIYIDDILIYAETLDELRPTAGNDCSITGTGSDPPATSLAARPTAAPSYLSDYVRAVEMDLSMIKKRK